MSTALQTAKINPHIVALEETRYLDDATRAQTGRLWTLYLYNGAEATHCCELTPSYWLVAYDFVTEKPVSEDVWSNLHSTLHESACYVHCRTIDAMLTAGFAEPLGTNSRGTWSSMDAAEEYLRGNQTHPKGLRAILLR